MPIRMTGLVSGLDTEAVVAQLMSAHTLKKTRVEQKKTKLEWKQEKWAELNTKIYKLYTDQLSKLRFQSNYKSKSTTSSNEDKVTAKAESGAGLGSHTISVSKLASAQYVTGAQVSFKNSTKLTECGFSEGQIITVKSGDKTKTLQVDSSTTISKFVDTLKSAGLNASFDEAQGRFFISGAESGEKNAFSITTSDMSGTAEGSDLLNARNAIISLAGSSAATTFFESYEKALNTRDEKQAAYETAKASGSGILDAWEAWQDAEEAVTKLEENLITAAEANAKSTATANAKNTVINDKTEAILNATEDDAANYEILNKITEATKKNFYKADDDGNVTEEFSEATLENAKKAINKEAATAINDAINNGTLTYNADGTLTDGVNEYADKDAAIEAKYAELVGGDEATALQAKAEELYQTALKNAAKAEATTYAGTEDGKAAIDALAETDTSVADARANAEAAIQTYDTALEAYNTSLNNGGASAASDTSGLTALGLGQITADGITGNSGATFTKAQNAVVVLDNATLTSETNSLTVAGVTYELKGETTEKVTIGINNDTKATFDMVKDFVKQYNELLTEMNELYYADAAKDYEPLTDEEKEVMSEKQIELWEDKIKDSLLRRDDTIASITSTMRTALASSVQVKGKTYSLSSFGICTGAYTEKGLLHIYGDEDDSTYGDLEDKLSAMLQSDPEVVAEVISKVTGNLYSALQDKMRTSSLSSALTFYNDKEFKKQIKEYDEDIDDWEDKLLDIEDRYYKQFTAMEKAMASLQQQQSYLSSMMGM